MWKKKDKRNEDEAAQKQQQPTKKPFCVGTAAAAAAADCANDVAKIEPPNLVVSTELSTAGANAVVDSRRPPQHNSFARRITVNFLGRKSKINGGKSMPSRSSLDDNNGCATNDQKPLVVGPSSSNIPSDMATVSLTSPEYKAQSRLFGIALLGVGVKKNGATDSSGGGDGNQRPQQKHRISSNNSNDMDDDERNECNAPPVAPPSKQCLSAPSAATTTTQPGIKMGEKADAIAEKPKERQKGPAKRTEDEEEKQEKKMPQEQRKEKPKRPPIKWKSDDEEEQKEKEESSVDQKKLAKAEEKAKEKAQKRADGGGESGGKTVRKARPQVQATASQAMNRRDAKGDCHTPPPVASPSKECHSTLSETAAAITTTEPSTKVGEKNAQVAVAKVEEKPKKRQKRPAKRTEDEEEKQEKKISPEKQREEPTRAPIKWFQTEDEEEENKGKEKEGETSAEKSQHHEQQQQQPLQTLASPTREQQPQQQQQEQKPMLRAKRSATWRREAVPNMTVKRRSAALDEVMNATIPGVSSPSLGAGLPHAMPRRRPRILTTLDGTRTLAPFFTNAFAFSNHFKCQFTVDGLEFCCTEQFYMYYKARVFGDEASAVAILRSQDAKAIKRFGAQIRLFDTAKWRKVSILVMLIGNWKKYEQNPMLRQFLFETGDALLVEASPDDIYWGCGVHVDNTDLVRDMNKWRGLGAKNVLGRLLTRIRDTFKERDQFKDEWAEVQSKLPELYGISSGGGGGGMPRRTI
ncbi:hypothetical protein niasHS_016795 [Heterodera schachtii]|uniref:NADAR domain-containing protein n=1 Tax=Heterodera schachtii TaxID=97005 RepID=A0ABD2HMQ3_HETSC